MNKMLHGSHLYADACESVTFSCTAVICQGVAKQALLDIVCRLPRVTRGKWIERIQAGVTGTDRTRAGTGVVEWHHLKALPPQVGLHGCLQEVAGGGYDGWLLRGSQGPHPLLLHGSLLVWRGLREAVSQRSNSHLGGVHWPTCRQSHLGGTAPGIRG